MCEHVHTHRVVVETWWHEALNKCAMEKNKSIFNMERNYYGSCILLHQEDLKCITTQEWLSTSSWYRQDGTCGGGRRGEEGFWVTKRQGKGFFLPFGGREQPGHHYCVRQKTATRLSALSLHRVCDQHCIRVVKPRKRGKEVWVVQIRALGLKISMLEGEKREQKGYTERQMDTSRILYIIWQADPTISFNTSNRNRASNRNGVFYESET